METDDEINKIELLSLPNEILTKIFTNLYEKDLFSVSHVCKLFAAIVEVAFAQKFSDQTFLVWGPKRIGPEKVMLSKYGEKVSKIEIKDVQNTEFLELVEEKCCNLTSVQLVRVPRILNFKGLKEVRFESISKVSKEELRNCIENNQQLETFEYIDSYFQNFGWVELLHNRLSMLKKFELTISIQFILSLVINIPQVTLESLEELKLYHSNKHVYTQFLRVLDCPKLKCLKIYEDKALDDELIAEIIKFKTLSTLDLIDGPVAIGHMEMLAKHLPNLTEFATKLKVSKMETKRGKCNNF